MSIAQGKLRQAQQSLRPGEAWVLYTAETRDPTFEFFGMKPIGATALVITQEHSYAVVPKLDANNVPDIFTEVRTYAKEGFEAPFIETVGRAKPRAVLANFSTADMQVDSLGHGAYINLENWLKRAGYDGRVHSALPLVYRLGNAKLPEETERLRRAATRAHSVIMEAFKQVTAGMTEVDIFNLVQQISGKKPDYAWPAEMCPIVLIGDRIGKTENAHSRPTDTKLQWGDMIYIDFGLREEGYGSDLQRAAYLPESGKKEVPAELQRRFDTIIKSIDAAAAQLRPGKRGWEADAAARKVLAEAGYPDYEHATGHPIGAFAHAPGPLLASTEFGSEATRYRARIPLEEEFVLTIEPRITLPNGVSIEEDVQVKADHVEWLSPRQLELFVVG